MIYTSSIIDGFKIILGSSAVHVSLLVSMLINITVPEQETANAALVVILWGREVDLVARNIYIGLSSMHALILVISYLINC